jgi:magnesium chelatase family protein
LRGTEEALMLARVFSGTVIGIDAHIVEVEVDIAPGLPSFTTVGLPETVVRESRERVKAAIQNSGYRFPDDRITVNLAPAGIRKEGTGFDLPIALGILTASRLIPGNGLERSWVWGELSLDGRVKAVRGSLAMAAAARAAGCRTVLLPGDNAAEASVIKGLSVLPVANLAQLVDFLNGRGAIEPQAEPVEWFTGAAPVWDCDFAEVVGQEHAKRALEVAAAGGHNLLMIGPPGSGKTMLARRLPTILPPLSFEEAIETTKVFSVAGMLEGDRALMRHRPFRAPHHTISDAGLIGGGHTPRPGEVSLAHHGVLFLDELTEFKPHVLEALRQPLEDRRVTIARASMSVTYPASVMLVAAMNPCPCGFLADPQHECRCSAHQIQRYRSRISGPLLDRIDLQVEVPAVACRELSAARPAEPSAGLAARVAAARDLQRRRYEKSRLHTNAQMVSRHIRAFCALDLAGTRLLENAVERLGFSARAYTRILKIARSIADLEGAETIAPGHLAEAVQYRSLDRRVRRV